MLVHIYLISYSILFTSIHIIKYCLPIILNYTLRHFSDAPFHWRSRHVADELSQFLNCSWSRYYCSSRFPWESHEWARHFQQCKPPRPWNLCGWMWSMHRKCHPRPTVEIITIIMQFKFECRSNSFDLPASASLADTESTGLCPRRQWISSNSRCFCWLKILDCCRAVDCSPWIPVHRPTATLSCWRVYCSLLKYEWNV